MSSCFRKNEGYLVDSVWCLMKQYSSRKRFSYLIQQAPKLTLEL